MQNIAKCIKLSKVFLNIERFLVSVETVTRLTFGSSHTQIYFKLYFPYMWAVGLHYNRIISLTLFKAFFYLHMCTVGFALTLSLWPVSKLFT